MAPNTSLELLGGETMRNKIVQFLYFALYRLVPVDKTKTGIMHEYKRMMFYMRLARLFGGPEIILIGNSNSAILRQRSAMMLFDKVAVCLGVGGTLAEDWVKFFALTKEGRKLKGMMRGARVIWNIGGNYCLRQKMDTMTIGMRGLWMLFPQSFNCTIPPVHDDIIEEIFHVPGWQIRENMHKINGVIKATWDPRVYDLYDLFHDHHEDGVYWWALRDIVHYSRYAVGIIIRLIRATT